MSDGSTYLITPASSGVENFSFRFWSYDFSPDTGGSVNIRGLRATVLYLDKA